MLSRTEMAINVIKKFGFEHKKTIWFCNLCEKLKNTKDNDNLIRYYYSTI